jgi:hypothetical protein
MKKIIFAILLIAATNNIFAQEINSKPPKIGWYITPEVGLMSLGNDALGKSIGKSVGFSFGFKFWKERIKVGFMAYGRPGPINSATFTTTFVNNQTYKGKKSADLRADWGTFGLMIAPTFKVKNVEIDVPIMLGGGAGGFYLVGEDRKTPDGARVSVWEDKLFNGEDAAFGTMAEVGVRAFVPTKIKGISVGAGLHYTMINGWKTLVDPNGDFYNNKLRASVFVNFGSN